MMNSGSALRYFALIFALCIVARCHPEGAHDFCAGVRRMYNQCNSYENMRDGTHVVLSRGKAGPKGTKGERGSDAVIDYDLLEQLIQRKLENATVELVRKYAEIRLIVDEHSKDINRVVRELNEKRITDCSKVDSENSTTANISRKTFAIFTGKRKIAVSCDRSTDGGRWTVIQRRMDGSEDFFRNHIDYVRGFGNVTGEFWIGLDNLYNILQASGQFELRIDMEDWDGVKKFAKYSSFDIGRPEDDYLLTASGYSGDAGDSFTGQSGAKFSTKDRDLDSYSKSCAQEFKGAWWYTDCHGSNLNGFYYKGGPHGSYADGVNWAGWKGYNYSLKFVEMKVRPLSI